MNAVLTMVRGRVVYREGAYADLAPPDRSPAGAVPVPDERQASLGNETRFAKAGHDGCANSYTMHGHDHEIAWSSHIPTKGLESFWRALN